MKRSLRLLYFCTTYVVVMIHILCTKNFFKTEVSASQPNSVIQHTWACARFLTLVMEFPQLLQSNGVPSPLISACVLPHSCVSLEG